MARIAYGKLKQRLLDEGATSQEARMVMQKVRRLDARLKMALYRWLEYGELPDFAVHDVSFADLQHIGMNECNAILTLDWLIREPEKAKAALRHPVDSVAITAETQASMQEFLGDGCADQQEENTADIDLATPAGWDLP